MLVVVCVFCVVCCVLSILSDCRFVLVFGICYMLFVLLFVIWRCLLFVVC